MNGLTPIDHANRLTGALGELDGVDLLNFGSDDRDTTITIGGGLRYRFTDNVQLGLGAETPITDSDDSKIGRASCRERVSQYVEISVVVVSLNKITNKVMKTHRTSTKLNN